jgi:hypothetical protein
MSELGKPGVMRSFSQSGAERTGVVVLPPVRISLYAVPLPTI